MSQEIPKYFKPEDPSKVMAYNHKPIGNGLPVVSNERFKRALELIDEGEVEMIGVLENHFALDEIQQQLLKDRKDRSLNQ